METLLDTDRCIYVEEHEYKEIKAFFLTTNFKTAIFVNKNMSKSQKEKCIEVITKEVANIENCTGIIKEFYKLELEVIT